MADNELCYASGCVVLNFGNNLDQLFKNIQKERFTFYDLLQIKVVGLEKIQNFQ